MGESLFVRLMNKNKQMGMEIGKASISYILGAPIAGGWFLNDFILIQGDRFLRKKTRILRRVRLQGEVKMMRKALR